PAGLHVACGDCQTGLAWNDNTEPDLAGYYVYRGTAEGGPYARLNGTPLKACALADSGLTNGATYWYRVTAADTSGNEGPPTPPVSAVPMPATYTISGTVTHNGAGLAGVTVSGGGKTAVTAADGTYALTGIKRGAYPVTARLYNYILSDPQTVTVGPDRSGVDFTAAETYSVGGTVKLNGVALAGATISAGGLTTTSNSNGGYILRGLVTGGYTVSASKAGYRFSAALSTTVGPNRSGLNFTAQPQYREHN
ncbi:MAG TPA: carboxypeptidase regulatory-like domain-containing protein, partial [Armatimonadota bacterium]|nr:carboxypeptidase regulatory-like domain-containing protein [Armatimonadota bacterium]